MAHDWMMIDVRFFPQSIEENIFFDAEIELQNYTDVESGNKAIFDRRVRNQICNFFVLGRTRMKVVPDSFSSV